MTEPTCIDLLARYGARYRIAYELPPDLRFQRGAVRAVEKQRRTAPESPQDVADGETDGAA